MAEIRLWWLLLIMAQVASHANCSPGALLMVSLSESTTYELPAYLGQLDTRYRPFPLERFRNCAGKIRREDVTAPTLIFRTCLRLH